MRAQFAEQVEQNGWEIALLKDPLVTEAYENLHLKKGRASSIQVSLNQEARAEGFQKGKSFQAPAGSIDAQMYGD